MRIFFLVALVLVLWRLGDWPFNQGYRYFPTYHERQAQMSTPGTAPVSESD